MSLAIKYENVEDAKMRLRSTLVLYKGQPVYITDVKAGEDKGDIMRVAFREVPLTDELIKPAVFHKGEPIRKYISSKHFDIAPFKMGYVNRADGTGAFYCSRMPNRVQKQGLCAENFKALDNTGHRVDFNTFLRCPETLAMVENRYPSFDKAVAGLKKVTSVAFHREYCLVKDVVIPKLIYLFYKGNKVGLFNQDEITLGEKFACLKESLFEMGLKVGGC